MGELPAHVRVVARGLEGKHRDEEEDEQLQRGRDAVVQEVADAAEDLARDDDRVHDCAQARLRQHDVGRRARLNRQSHGHCSKIQPLRLSARWAAARSAHGPA
jgi:hypothetical protein